MVNRRGPSNINLGIFVPLMFAGLYSGFITIPLFGDDSSQPLGKLGSQWHCKVVGCFFFCQSLAL